MKSFFKGLWSRTQSESEVRQLIHPSQLEVDDFLRFSDSYGLPGLLRDKPFRVAGVMTFQYEREWQTTFGLQSETDEELDLTIEKDGGRETASLSLSVSRSEVERIFDLDEFADIFDSTEPSRLDRIDDSVVSGWTAGPYFQQIGGQRGYFYDSDSRAQGPSEYEGDGEPFDYFFLLNADETHGVEIYVYEGGETEVSLTIHRPIEDIVELWPGKQKEA